MATINLTKEDFLTKVYNYEENSTEWKFLGDKPILIDFYASWCGPCKMMSPIIDEMAEDYAGKVDVYKVNVDEEEELASVFGIRSIPTLVFASKDQAPQSSLGAMSRSALKELINKML